MISLINFKPVDEDKSQQDAPSPICINVKPGGPNGGGQQLAQFEPAAPAASFVVTWRNLSFALKQSKWQHKLFQSSAAIFNSTTPTSPASQKTTKVQQQQDSKLDTKLVLDGLDGSFKSGELTAILGPSGAGKTTLLDCLTGHKKHGLSGSIRISPARGGNNLKVSIIPQNDHLMGHLSVYETLSYASKMKNCHDKQFDHKLNIKRVSQQLGLASCLTTRINKLSGGQYKRVSIAQELLSSPDILILDEPTSGLDAMTCYKTVQVLRKLTMLNQSEQTKQQQQQQQQKQIAVILTIHQPNSDVFQQFNHVYVVAQGGKCIYEGPPSDIESFIKRVGLSLPNSHYNPATMIVEIAACKFGPDFIEKLNSIQKKLHHNAKWSRHISSDKCADENSIGDSAVDFGAASSSNDDEDYTSKSALGLVNKAFVAADGDEQPASADNDDEAVDEADGAQTPENRKHRQKRRVRKRSVVASNEAAHLSVAVDCSAPDRRHFEAAGNSSLSSYSICSTTSSSSSASSSSTDQRHHPNKRLKLNSLRSDQKFPFWRHTYLHFHRCWLSIVRDPMLCSMQLALHVIVPLMVSLVYGTQVGVPNACPRAGPVDIMAYALEPADTALKLQEDLRTTLENIGYIFFKLYGIIFAAMTVTVLTFPLDMHVLVKEFRNGWYGLSSYFIGRTLADIPFQLTLPLLAMSLSYYSTGQPYSYLQWRFLSITAILILSSLIAQSQGLLFGAILMDKMKAAVFVAPAATTPIILFAGFLVRTQSIPSYLRPLSNLSYLRYAIEACLISRYGFNQCDCDPQVFNQTVPELPPMARSMLDYWLSSFKPSPENDTAIETTTLSPVDQHPDLFTKLMNSLAKANSFGRNITSCEQVVPYPLIDYDLKDSQLFNCFAILIFMLIFTRLLTFFIVCSKVNRKV